MAVKAFYVKGTLASGVGATGPFSLQDGGSTSSFPLTTQRFIPGTFTSGYATMQTSAPASTFTSTVQPASPLGTEDSFRSESPISGVFVAGLWSFAVHAISVNANYNGTGKVRFRLWKSANANGASATEITTSVAEGTVGNLTTAASSPTSFSSTFPTVAFSNQYLFLQVGFQIVSATGNTANSDVAIITGNSAIQTSNFLPSYAGTVSPYDIRAYDANGSAPRVSVLGGVSPVSLTTFDSNQERSPAFAGNLIGSSGTGTVTNYYAMRGRDSVAYRTWVATGAPDTTGSQYTGTLSGSLSDIIVLHSWAQ